MVFVGLFILELFLLYFLSHNVSVLFSRFFFSLTRSKRLTIHLLAFLFLPGTLLHELAHWLAAVVLFVSVGNISLLPKLEDRGLKLGSVSIERTDPIRRLLIGTAPVLMGISIIIATFYFALQNNLFANYWIILLLGYIVFEVGNTMFSSQKDMEGALELLLVVLFIGTICYFLGFRIQINTIINAFSDSPIVTIFQKGSLYLLFPIIVDALCIFLLRIFHR